MKAGELLTGLTLAAAGGLVIVSSSRLGLQRLSDPGPGLYPFLLGILLCLLVIPVVAGSLVRKTPAPQVQAGAPSEFKGAVRKLIVPVSSLVGYFFLLETLGFLITSFLFLGLLFWYGHRGQRTLVLLFPLIVVAASYLIFQVLLQVPFPQGLWR